MAKRGRTIVKVKRLTIVRNKIRVLSNINKSYLAGIIDGEGCISIGRNCKKQFYSYLSVEMGDSKVPLFFYNKLGGSIKNRIRKNRKIYMYCWYISGEASKLILEKLLPYLITKKEEAKLLIKYQKTIRNGNNQYRHYLNTNTINYRLELIKKLKSIKIGAK